MKAILYFRFSPRPNAAECESIDAQRDIVNGYCAKQQHEVVEEFSDPDSMGDDENRTGLWQAIDAMKRGMVLVAWRGDRLARNVYLSELIYREAARKKWSIEVVDGGRNGTSSEDILVRQILSAVGEYEKRVIAARTRAMMLRHQAAGRAMSLVPPYGFTRIGSELVPNAREQASVIRLLYWHDQGYKLRQIARMLDEEGAPCRGAKWTHQLVKKVLVRLGKLIAKAG